MSFQQTIIIGNVGRDCELTYTPSGIAVAKFTVAVNEVSGKGDDRKEKVTWFRVTVWREKAETASQFVKKGMQIMVMGKVDVSAYLNKENKPTGTLELTAHNFQFLSSNRREGGNTTSDVEPPNDAPNTSDIPF
jgi:single-strand DNA-binding protein